LEVTEYMEVFQNGSQIYATKKQTRGYIEEKTKQVKKP
jgi:hypothetical protein